MKSFVLNFAAFLLLAAGPCDSTHLTQQCHSGTLRLRLNDSVLQICKHGQWKIVCSEEWGNLDAAVACRQLGYDGGYTNSTTISNPGLIEVDPIVYDCTGREKHGLQDCTHHAYSRCSSTDGATLTCLNKTASDPCSSGDIRFIGNTTEYEGHIEVCTDHGLWSIISAYSWSFTDAVVACRQLGFTDSIASVLRIYNDAHISRFRPLEYGGVACRGNETSIQSCSADDYFVQSYISELWYTQRFWRFAAVSCIPRTNDNCKDGSFRITNGYSNNNGLVEVCVRGSWIGFCTSRSSGYSRIFTHICNQLGYQRHIEIDGSTFQANRSQVYVSPRSYCQPQSSLLDCVYNNTYYGYQYQRTCSSQTGVLCCPNDTALCSFQPTNITSDCVTSSAATTTASATTSTVSPSTDTPIPPPEEAQFSLHFGTAATSLLLGSSLDLRGLKADIEDKIMACVSEESDCPNKNNMAPVDKGFFSVGDTLTYTSNLNKLNCVNTLKKCLEKDPWIQYHGSDIHLTASIV